MLELATSLAQAELGELACGELARASLERLVRSNRLALGELLVEQAEVIDRERRRGLLVERGNLVQDVDSLLVAALREQELGPAR